MSSGETTASGAATTNFGGHAVPLDSPALTMQPQLPPLVEVPAAPLRSAAEEARTILASNVVGTLATLTDGGDPWASVITYGVLADGSPVFSLSTLALHGRNLRADQRASLAVSEAIPPGRDPADCGRVTLAGVVEEPREAELEQARRAYAASVASAAVFGEFGDFDWWVLRAQRVRWVGGFGRMASVKPAQLASAEPDPVASAAEAIEALNASHADELLQAARALTGHSDAEAATCVGADRYGLDLDLLTPRGRTSARIALEPPVGEADGLLDAALALLHHAA